jgi:methionyl-tRNA formyltransferase
VTLAPVPERPHRLVYLGTPAMAVPPLEALHAAGFDIALVVSRADTRRGRGGRPSPSPVKAAAASLGLATSDRVEDAVAVGADLGVVVAFGQIIRRPVLEQLPMVNLHFSLLPRWRGAAPVERAILAGDERTGVDLMQVVEALDAGDVYARRELSIGPDETAAELRRRLVAAGSDLLVSTLGAGLRDPRPQSGEATYAHKLDPAELELRWDASAVELQRLVRVGGAWTTFRGARLKVWDARPGPSAGLGVGEIDGTRVGTGQGSLRLVEVQPEGRRRQPADDWRNGSRIRPGEVLGRPTPTGSS